MANEQGAQTTSDNRIFGLRKPDILGLCLMAVCVWISYQEFSYTARKFWWWPFWHEVRKTGLTPDYQCAFAAVIFYAALIVRYDIFQKDTFLQALTSTVRAFLNCFATAALLSPILSAANNVQPITLLGFEFSASTLIVIAVLFSWLGREELAGYSWMLFVVAALYQVNTVSRAMSVYGAHFVIAYAVSLFLQTVNLRQTLKNIGGAARNAASSDFATNVKNDMNAAVKHGAQYAGLGSLVQESEPKIPSSSTKELSSESTVVDDEGVTVQLQRHQRRTSARYLDSWGKKR